ncbi:NADPH-dependent FMN reductase [Companilactobacillus halodurans]|uniref:NAD(P)H-dependent oxidoreductase n=1 Tax=Companilactobacillus halodurans TaxID=2584183 RepID=A0A5P0ZTZ4_9LACO|nr:NAD(P)H-dependent oxidoreductase [Companilactobacillus halodurans]MQS76014.1 NAD(P)H-dependent oxidoreductase [Companilactobacillus halodurans]MQS96450.1 NAD(P)H-dependent oxidoreductase [Companilactobacillus halodurans]
MGIKIGVILGTTRKHSLGGRIFKYLQNNIQSNADVKYTWIKLRDYPLPLYDHEETPLEEPIQDLNSNESEWLATLKQQDGYLILTPEYDHALPGGLKNAFDLVGPEVSRKPVQIIAYSHYSDGGTLAARSIVPILQMLKMIVLPTPALLWDADKNFTEHGDLQMDVLNSEHFAKRLQDVFVEINFYTSVLKQNPFLKNDDKPKAD